MNTIIIIISIILIVLIAIALPFVLIIIPGTRSYGRNMYSVDSLLEELGAMGFEEVKIRMFKLASNFDDGPIRFYRKYRSKSLYKECSVTIYTNLSGSTPSRDGYYSPYSSGFRIEFESLNMTKYKNQSSEWPAFTLLTDNGKKINKKRLDFLHEQYLAAPAIDILYDGSRVKKPSPHQV